MSETDTLQELQNQLDRTRRVASIALTIAVSAFAWVMMAFVVNNNQANSIRELQRQVLQLESERRR